MRRRLTVLVLATAVIAASAACGSSGTSNPPQSTPGTPDKVKAGVIAIVDVAPIYLGKSKGFFTNRGIDLTLETAQGGAAIVPAVVAGQ